MEDARRKLRFNLAMDLSLLRQIRGQGDAVFSRGSPVLEIVARELAQFDPEAFGGITKKAVRDRLYLLLDQHKRKKEWSKKQSGSSEEFDEKTQLLTELQELYDDRDAMVTKQKEDKHADMQRAVVLRENACKTLRRKDNGETTEGSDDDSARPAKKRRSYGSYGSTPSSTECVVSYLHEKQEANHTIEKERIQLEKDRLRLQELEFEQKMARENVEQEEKRKKEEDDRRERLAVLTLLDRIADKLT